MKTTKWKFDIKRYTKTQLVTELGFKSSKELDDAMKKAGQEEKLKKKGWYYYPRQVEEILVALELPINTLKVA